MRVETVLRKHGLAYSNLNTEFFSADRLLCFSYFGDAGSLEHCCAVIEFGELSYPQGFTLPEHKALFKFQILDELAERNRKQAIVTTTQKQKRFVPLLKAAGFVNVGTRVNSGSGNKVTIWVLNT